jgi:tol-pal system protein YbgF
MQRIFHLNITMRPLITFICGIQLFLGCASRKEIVQFKYDMTNLRTMTEGLRKSNADLRKEIAALNQSVSNTNEQIRQTRADLLAELTELKDQTHYIESKIDERYFPARNNMSNDDSLATPPVQDGGVQIRADEIYDAAYLDLVAGRFDLALQGFQEFVNRYPRSDLAHDAQYWIGEVFYAKGDYIQATDEFTKVILKYPRGSKIPISLFKMGECELQKGNPMMARQHFKSIVDNFPFSEEAILAKEKMEEIK